MERRTSLETPKAFSRLLLSLAIILVVLITGAFLKQQLSLAGAVGPAHPQSNHSDVVGDIITPRSTTSATLLRDGKVLIAGGYGTLFGGQLSDPLNSAELYDPTTGTWSATGNLSKSYYWLTATLLHNGKVLVVGSLYFGTNKTTELFDPATGTWAITGSLNIGRLCHTATLLSNGKVLVLGGFDRPSSAVYDSAELYDPSTGTWTLAGNLNSSRVGHTATMLRNGQILVAGGWNGSGLLRSTELYDAGIDITNPLDDARFFVRQHYLDFLNREPDQAGWDYWAHQITQCNVNQLCIHKRRVAVSDPFFFEPEYQQTGAYVYRLYRAAYGNNQPFPNPDTSNETESKKLPSRAAFVSDRGRVVGGANLAQLQLDLANLFVRRPEFLAK